MHQTPLPLTALDIHVAAEPALHGAVGRVGEAWLGVLLQGELAPVRMADREDSSELFEILDTTLDDMVRAYPAAAEGPGPDDLRAMLGRACVVLAIAQQHRLFRPLLAFARHRIGRHLLARPALVRAAIARNAGFGRAFEGALSQLAEATGAPPAQLLQPRAVEAPGDGVHRCAFCERAWRGVMPQMQVMPATLEPVDDEAGIHASRESVIELGGSRYHLALQGDTPLQHVCRQGHVIDALCAAPSAVFDPWLGQLVVGPLPPEDDELWLRGWRRFSVAT